MHSRLVAIVATCLLATGSLASAEEPRLVVQVMQPEGGPAESVMLAGLLTARLTKTDLDVVAAGLGPPSASPMMDSSDLHIHYAVGEVAAGQLPVRVWAIESVTGDKVVEVEGKAAVRKGRPVKAGWTNRMMEAAMEEAAGKLVAGLDAYRARLRAEGGPARIELRGAPPKLAGALAAMLKAKGTKVQEKPGSQGVKVWLMRTKLDTLELSAAIAAVIEEKAPKLDYDFTRKYRGSIIVVCRK